MIWMQSTTSAKLAIEPTGGVPVSASVLRLDHSCSARSNNGTEPPEISEVIGSGELEEVTDRCKPSMEVVLKCFLQYFG